MRAHAPATRAWRQALRTASSWPVVGLGLRMSLCIGTLLNVINQGDALFGDAPLSVGKLCLTYMVPYCVATYSATSVTLRLLTPPANR